MLKKTLFSSVFVCWLSGAAQAAETIELNAEDGWYPFSGVVDGKLQGFAVDMIAAAYESVGVKVVSNAKPYARCSKEVIDGKVLGCFDTVKQATNEATFLWHSKPMFQEKLAIWARMDSKESNLTANELDGKEVGTTIGYEYSDAVDKNPKIIKKEAPSDEALLKMLANGRVNYALVYERVAYAMMNADPAVKGKIKIIGEVLITDLYISFSKTFPNAAKYVKLFEEGYEKILANGRFKALEAEWAKKTGVVQ